MFTSMTSHLMQVPSQIASRVDFMIFCSKLLDALFHDLT